MARGGRPILYGPRGGLPLVGAFPGQPGNPVGFAAAPGWPGSFQNFAQGFPTNPTALGDGTGGTLALTSNTTYSFLNISPVGFGSNIISSDGLIGHPSATPVNGVHDITFIGCRFTANTNLTSPDSCVECVSAGSFNIQFLYCSFVPLPSIALNPPPGTNWPSSSVGTGAVFTTTGTGGAPPQPGNTYQMTWGVTYRDALAVAVPTTKFVTVDHCDMWGWADGITTTGLPWTSLNTYPPNGQLNITDNWVHDCRTDNNNVDHSNAIIFASNNASASNVLVKHNTLSGLGNTNTIALQHLAVSAGNFYDAANSYSPGATLIGALDGFAYQCVLANGPGNVQSPIANTTYWHQAAVNSYQNIQVLNNHISGMSVGVDMGVGLGGSTGIVFTDNIISNYVMWLNRIVTVSNSFNGPNGNNVGATFNGTNGNLWKRNVYQMWPGSGTGGSYDTGNPATNDGKFVLPAETVLGGGNFISSTDWHN
jgi:hypothetical protein